MDRLITWLFKAFVVMAFMMAIFANIVQGKQPTPPVIEYNAETCELCIVDIGDPPFLGWFLCVDEDQRIGVYDSPQEWAVITIHISETTAPVIDMGQYPAFRCEVAVHTEAVSWAAIRRQYR